MKSNESPHDFLVIDGKLGLCLSGGGFRAALFHIGTLAALAERGVLHQVEVLSTVSGGSIIGAYYYLKVKQLLEGKRPGCPIPAPDHYLDIVQEIERDFLVAVQKNLRMRLFLRPYSTAKMLLDEEYTRSDKLAELLNELFYNDISLVEKIHLNAIHITPQNSGEFSGEKGVFDVDIYNRTATCKIPVLTINATCLNTGHPFHFTGSWVGEPLRRDLYSLEQNTNCTLPQMRFDGRFQEKRGERIADRQLKTLSTILLSDAVAASAAVPGLFPPLPIHNLYENDGGEEIVVELSDGGVFDNQGLDALFASACTHIIVSDASGQLEDERLLPTDMLSAGMRANNIMMERIRGYGYFDLYMRGERCQGIAGAATSHTKICFIQSSAFTHLREQAANTLEMPALPGPVDRQGGVVYRLSGMRTDFDSFSDMEAYTLMYQGYVLAQAKLNVFAARAISAPLRPWRFLEIREVIKHGLCRLAEHLTVSKKMFFKPFRLAPLASWTWLTLLLFPWLFVAGIWLCDHWNSTVSLPAINHSWGELIVWGVPVIFGLLPISSTMRKWFKVLPWLRKAKTNCLTVGVVTLGIAVLTVLALIVSLSVYITLNIFNNIFLKVGKLKR